MFWLKQYRLLGLFAFVAVLVLAARVSTAASLPVHFTTSVTPSTAHPGEIVTATVHVAIDDGWHVYSCNPPASGGPSASVIDSLGSYQAVGPTTEETPIRAHDPNFDLDVAYHEKSATFSRQFRVPAAGAAGSSVVFHYQTCNHQI